RRPASLAARGPLGVLIWTVMPVTAVRTVTVPSPLSAAVRSLDEPANPSRTDFPFAGLVDVYVPDPVDLNSGNPVLDSRSLLLSTWSRVVVTGMRQITSSNVATTCWCEWSTSSAAAGLATPNASDARGE